MKTAHISDMYDNTSSSPPSYHIPWSYHVLLPRMCLLFLSFQLISQTACSFDTLRMAQSDESKLNTRSSSDVESRINDLLGKMTIREKLGQLHQGDGDYYHGNYLPKHLIEARQGLLGSIINVRGAKFSNELQKAALESRLKIPVLTGYDVIHGYRTLFPIPLGEAASWDLELAERCAAVAAKEARSAGVQWTFAPMVDLSRDARWGRVMEGAGEDVFLSEEMAKARVRGFQGTDYSQGDRVMACAKHFAAYGASEGGLDYNSVDMSEHRLRAVYLPPFKAAVDAGVGSIMAAYIGLNGVPIAANKFMLRQVLRNEWKFDGLVVADYNIISELLRQGVAANGSEAAQLGLNSGVNLEMTSDLYLQHGEDLVSSGKVTMETVDEAVRNVLRAKFRLGLFENPWASEELEKNTLRRPEFLQAAREAAAKSFVLLKNDKKTLPIDRTNIKSVAVIGGLADDKANTLDFWSAEARADESITVLQGVRDKLAGSDVYVLYAKGCDATSLSDKDFPAAAEAAKKADFSIVVVGEGKEGSGEAGSVVDLGLSGRQLDLVKAVHSAGKPYVVVLTNGRPFAISWLAENSPAILVTWKSGTMGGAAVADVLFGDFNPGGKLPMTFPRHTGQVPLYYDQKPVGRPVDPNNPDFRFAARYIDCPPGPLYEFGFGLSYTTFKIDNLTLSKTTIREDEKLSVFVDLENVGGRPGAEVVQLYVRDVVGSMTRPLRQLKAFRKVDLAVGEKKKLEFVLGRDDLAFYNQEMKWVVEPGVFQVFVGNSSAASLGAQFVVSSV